MKKQILNLGKALSKAEQQKINGGICGEPGVICFQGNHIGSEQECLEYPFGMWYECGICMESNSQHFPPC